MKPKMKKNPDFRRHHGGGNNNNNNRRAISEQQQQHHYNDGDDELGFEDKKYSNRRERRVFSKNNISRYYKEHLEPRLRAEMEEDADT